MADLAYQFPVSPGFQSVNFKIVSPNQTTNTLSGKVRRTGMATSYYTWEVKYPSVTPREAGTVQGFVSQALGQQYSFEIILPKISYTKLAATQTTSTPVASATTPVGSTSITLTGCGTSKSVLAAGDFFKFSNHSKVYMCVTDCSSNSGGAATLYFSCPLVNQVVSGNTLTITAVPFTAILAEDTQTFDVGVGGITSMSLQMREVW
jgi:hypothetical protein